MAVIKCSNCENEILDTDIVCPYCDYPVRGTSEKPSEEKKAESHISDQTMKVTVNRDSLKNKEEKKAEPKTAGSDVNEPKASQQPKAKPTAPIGANNTDIPKQDENSAPKAPTASEEDAADVTRKVSADDVHSEALRRSLEERRAAREAERRKQKKRKDSKMIIIGITIVGIFVIIYLLANVISNILGEGIFDKEKENKKADKVVTSEAEMADLGFKFHSHTLTIVEQSVLMDDYTPNAEKPWKEYSLDTSNLTIASGIENISAHAFDDLINLTHVTIAPTVSSIGESAFYGCSKLEVIALDSAKSKLASIGDYAFTDCSSLEDVVLGKKIKRIGEGAFKSCDSLQKITIPASVTEIGADAFLGCPDLVIVCDNGSYAYEYATANGIDVELTDEETEEDTEEETFSYSGDTSEQSTTTNKQSSGDSNNSSKKDTNKESKKENDKESNKESNKDSDNKKNENTQTDTSKNNTTSTSDNNNQTNSGTEAESPNLETLIDSLNSATTQAEKDKILGQIDEVVGGN